MRKERQRKTRKRIGKQSKAKQSNETSTVGTARKNKENHRTTTGKAIGTIRKAGKPTGKARQIIGQIRKISRKTIGKATNNNRKTMRKKRKTLGNAKED